MPSTNRADLLVVDLTAATVRREPLPPETRGRMLGGRGLAGAYLEASIRLPFDDDRAVLCFFPGRLAGFDLPGSGRLAMVCLSPRGVVVRCGLDGRVGPALARAGLAGVVVTGRAARPCGLCVRDGEAWLEDAGALWGQTTDAVFAALGAFDGVLTVGPAATAGSPLAAVVADRWHAAGRGGPGLAMAARNLLYMAVTGHDAPQAADPAALTGARAAMERLIAASPALAGPCGLGRFGTAALVDLTSGRRMQPTDNFRRTVFPRAAGVNGPCLDRRFPGRPVGCPGCPVGCRRIGPDGGALPDLDALSHFTALLGLDDPVLAVRANAFCLRHGLDAAGCAVALAGHAEATGQSLDAAGVMPLLGEMAAMVGLGRALSLAAPAMSVKGMALPAFDPRGAYGLALSLAVATAGPDPWEGGCLAHELLRKPVATDRFTFDGKARAVVLGENAAAAVASLGGCPLLSLAVTLEEWALALAAVTGQPASAGELAGLGARVVADERRQNAARGMDASADDLPGRFFVEPGSGGDGIEVPPLSREAFLAAREKYFRLRGLDAAGRPLPASGVAEESLWTH